LLHLQGLPLGTIWHEQGTQHDCAERFWRPMWLQNPLFAV
jgi:hypothetical protein